MAKVKAMRAAVTPGSYICVHETGFIASDHGYANMASEDRAVYDAAIAEYLNYRSPCINGSEHKRRCLRDSNGMRSAS